MARCGKSSFLREPLRAGALIDSYELSLKKSASGGAFAVLARPMLESGGVVFGCTADGGNVRHVAVETLEELTNLQGSKYVQSRVGDCYHEVAEFLAGDRRVLFSGTPCQVAGLRTFLHCSNVSKQRQDNLLTCDLVCHGTPSPKLFEGYLAWLMSKYGPEAIVSDYAFRSKKVGWSLYYYYYYQKAPSDAPRVALGPAKSDPYYAAFLRGATYRESCYRCPFARKERVGDFTIGDFWGIQSVLPKVDTTHGVSAVLINSERGGEYFDRNCATNCTWVDSSFDEIARENHNLRAPTSLEPSDKALRNELDEAIANEDWQRIFGDILRPNLSAADKLKAALPVSVMRELKKLKGRATRHGK